MISGIVWNVNKRPCSHPVVAQAIRGTLATVQNFVNQTIGFCIFCAHEIIPIRVSCNLFDLLAGVLGQDPVEFFPDQQYLPGVYIDICRLPLKTTQWLVNHNA